MPSFKTALVICLCLASILTANPVYRIRELDSLPAKYTQLLHGSESQITSNTNGKLCSSSDRLCKLHRRTRYLTEARTVREAKRTDLKKRSAVRLTSFKVHGGIVPVFAAAPYVQSFFDAIAVQASTVWTFRPETALFTVTQGPLQLTVSCLGASIPWPLLVSVALRFSALAADSWVNTFDVYYEDPESSITLAVSLRLFSRIASGLEIMTTSLHPQKRTLLHGQTLSATSSTLLPPRTIPPPHPLLSPPSLKLAHFIQTVSLVPTALAAAKLEDFYTIIALKIETGQLSTRPPSKYLVCSLWDFELSFSCDSIDVPLSFVQAFVIDMATWSARQFTGFYEATVTGEGPLSGLVFLVRMRLRDEGGLG